MKGIYNSNSFVGAITGSDNRHHVCTHTHKATKYFCGKPVGGGRMWRREMVALTDTYTHMHTLVHAVSALQLWSYWIKGSHREFCACEGHFLNIYVQMLQQLHYVPRMPCSTQTHLNVLAGVGGSCVPSCVVFLGAAD